MQRYSLAEAKNRLTAIVRDVENRALVELTRRGKPVAVILSIEEYRQLTEGSRSFIDAYEQFRQTFDLEALGLGPELFAGMRQVEVAPEVEW
jgi:prevent-host-death family protein